ncbi:MAG: hypothetical protein Q4P32_13400, partial [Micrococcales bacterium]|nr:hypothetical protein [Micrococcales bacterium]
MSLVRLVDVLTQDPTVRRVLALTASPGTEAFYDVTVAAGARPALLTAMVQALGESHADRDSASTTGGQAPTPRPAVLVVTATTRASQDLVEALRCYLPPERIAEFPSWET